MEVLQGKTWGVGHRGDAFGNGSSKTVCAWSWKEAVTAVDSGLVFFSFAL